MVEKVTIGNAELYLGDCRDVLPSVPAINACIFDPPYGVGLGYASHDDSDLEAYRALMRAVMDHRFRWIVTAVTPGMKHHVWWYQQFSPRWTISWHKPNQCSRSALGGFNAWEPILVWGTPPGPVPHDAFVQPIETAQQDTGDHPCPKDPRAWRRLVKMMTADDDLVLDPFMGSGTTGVACAQLGRKFIGIEIEPKYFEIALRRIEEAQRQGDLIRDVLPKAEQKALDL